MSSEKKAIQVMALIPLLAVPLLFFYLWTPPALAKKTPGREKLVEAAAKLMATEVQYLEARQESHWQKIYDLQTAHYRKKVPFEEFVYYGGQKTSDWKSYAKEHNMVIRLSGAQAPVPSREEMRAKITKEKPVYHIVGGGGSFPGRASRFEIGDRVQISQDGNHARIEVKTDVQWIAATIFMDVFTKVDFWDLEDGQWRVQLDRWDYRPISGMRKPPGPELVYENIPLQEIIRYRIRKGDGLYARGEKKKAGTQYRLAVELRPLATYQKVPVKDPIIRNVIRGPVLRKIKEWEEYLGHRQMTDSKVKSEGSWTPAQIKAKRAELEKIKRIFAQ